MKDEVCQFVSNANQLFRALANTCSDYIYMWDVQSGLYTVSDNFTKEFTIAKDGRNFLNQWYSFLDERDLERVKEAFQKAIQNKRTKLVVEYQATNTLGNTMWLSDHATIIYHDDNNQEVTLIGAMHNLIHDGDVDHVTGLLKHTKCKEEFENKGNVNDFQQGVMMLLGIDEFAMINTLNNHSFGDLVLRETAQIIINILPENWEMYRYDGDQFLIVADKGTKEDLYAFYENVKEYASSSHKLEGIRYRFTVSAGMACYPQDGIQWGEIEKSVSVALKQAKETGKNHCVEFTNSLLKEKIYEQSLVQDLSTDIERGFRGFHVVFQPICTTKELKIKGAEILLRYSTPRGQAMRPDEFIPLLEQSQLIIPVGLWVLEQAIATCKKWTNYIKDFVMNVNVSYLQLRDIAFGDKVEQLLKKYDLSVRHITIELTESYFITDAPNINVTMNRLQDLHLQVAMDDFGTGYSSLARLSQFNVDVVKIDRSFVQSLHRSKYNHDFVDSVIRLCHNVGMKVCVEGVETKEEQEIICVLHADYVQGYYVSKPIDEEAFYKIFILDPHANESLVTKPNTQLRREQITSDRDVLHALMEATPLGLSFWNRDFEVIACNSEILRLLGASNFEEFKNDFFLYSPKKQEDGKDSIEKVKENIHYVFSGGTTRVYWQHCYRGGEIIPTELTLTRIPYMDDYIVAGFARDMREQKQMEEQIEMFNTKLKAILDATPLCLNLWNDKFENTMCNKAAVDLFNLNDPEEYMNRFFELSPEYQPDGSLSNDKAVEHIIKAFADGRDQFEWMHNTLEGENIPSEITLVKIDGLQEHGGSLVAGYTRDLRKQKSMEDKIEKFNIRLKAILDSTPLCLNLWNKQFENTMCNKAAVELFSLQNKEEYMELFFELSPKCQPDGSLSDDKALHHIKRAFANGKETFMWMHQRLDGQEIPTEITLVRIEGLGEDGEDLVAGYTRDLREQVKNEKTQETITTRIRAMLDSSPIACILWSSDLQIIDCNQEVIHMLEAKNKDDILQNFQFFLPQKQPNGDCSVDKMNSIFADLLVKERLLFEWVYINSEKEEVPCEVSLVKLKLEGEEIIIAYSRDLRELHQTLELNDRLSKMAYYDLLTGVISRARFIEKMNFILEDKSYTSSTLIIFDIDHFKIINDTYGHVAGDKVLRKIARHIHQMLPKEAVFGRFGGDEFVILMNNVKEEALLTVMCNIVNSVSKIEFEWDDIKFNTSISMGASFKQEGDADYHQLLARADKALYKAKQNGRNQFNIL